ncbi:MAG TPA: flagellar hook-length control protein FliK [Bacillota bacterium]|nr:flagellar hook-length control protein FliK [Bacillota bacterium]
MAATVHAAAESQPVPVAPKAQKASPLTTVPPAVTTLAALPPANPPAPAGTAPAVAPAPAVPEPKLVPQPASFSIPSNSGTWTLQVAPPGLGPVHVRLDLKGGALDTRFLVSDPGAKSALEANLAALRINLAGQGVNVGNLDVGLNHTGGHGAGYEQPAYGQSRRVPVPLQSAGPAPPRRQAVGALNLLG